MTRAAMAWALVALTFALVSPAHAVPPGMTVEFDGQGEGKVTFAGTTHTGPGMHCSNCHLEIFDLSRSSQITKPDHKTRQYCFFCHDGKTAFAARGKCARCHAESGPVDPLPQTADASPPPDPGGASP
jgi:c(7)-type cytochrome triheme protein